MSLWLRNLTEVLDHHPIVILHGNVRDCYLDQAGHLHDNLTTLLRQLARTPQWRIQQFVCYDLADGERIETLQAPPASAKPSRKPVDDDLAATTATDPSTNQRLPPDRILARWRSQAELVDSNIFWVINYLDKLVTYKPSYSGDEQELLLRLEKLIENLRPNHRLVLLALRDTQIPVELYTHAPKVRVVAIPLPDITDRREFLQFRLADAPPLLAQLTDGMCLRDLDPIVAKLGKQRSSEAIKQAVDRYRFGERDNPWAQLQIETLHRGLTWLRDEQGIQGQDRPIRQVMDTLIRARAGLSGLSSGTAAKPKGVLFFAGPTGVGKTLLAKNLAQLLFGAEEAFVRLDMSELKEEHTVSKLIGSPPGYVGSESGGKLTNAVRERPYTVVLCDEIEKAHPHILDVFLQLLEDGRLTDSRGQTTFFTETLVIFTSNIGARTLDSRNRPLDERERLERLLGQQPIDEDQVAQHFIQAVESYFQFEISRPELLNRLGDNIIPFNVINGAAIQAAMVRAHFRRIEAAFAEIHKARSYKLTVDDTLVPWLVELLGERIRTFGGRAVTNAIEGKLMTPLAREVLRQEHAGVSNYHFGLKWDARRKQVEVYRV